MTFNLLMMFTLLHYYTIIVLDINTYILIHIQYCCFNKVQVF